MIMPAWKRTLLTCFDVKEQPGDKHSKLYSCRYCNDPSWQDKRQESVTRLLEHITGLRRRDGKPCKQCVGKVALEVRNQLRDHMQSVSTQRPATSTRRAASEAPPLPILPAEDVETTTTTRRLSHFQRAFSSLAITVSKNVPLMLASTTCAARWIHS